LLLGPDLRILAASDAYLQATMTVREEIVGQGVFEVFPEPPEETEGGKVSQTRASMQLALREKTSHRLPPFRYAIPRPASEGGAFEERYWSAVNTPVIGPDGEVELIIHAVEDVTKVVQLQRERADQSRDFRELFERSEHFVELLDSAPDAIVITGSDGLIQLVNLQTERLFGYRRDELIGKPLDMLVPDRFRGGHAAHIARYFANPAARPMGSGLELFGRRRDGTELPIEVSLSPHRRGGTLSVSAAIRDTSERRRLEAAARLNAERLASAVDSMQDAFALFDSDDCLILCNSVYRRLLHANAPGALVGKPFAELLEAWSKDMAFDDDAQRARWRDERIEARRRERTTVFDVRLLDGRRMRVVDRRTAEGGVVKTIWDLTAEERRAEELREARVAAEAASEAKSEFLASMSHELRTPLNAILGFAQLLQRDRREPLSQRHRERVGHILTGGEHLLRLIDDVLDLARVEAGRISVAQESVDARSVIDEVVQTLEPLAMRHGIRLWVEDPTQHLPTLLADRTRVAQVLMNLGSNAVKYNRPQGEVVFRCAVLPTGQLRIAVRDTGVGIPLDKQSKLFQPFQRAGQETGPIEGTGIGLVISRRLAVLMAGDVGFHSVPGEGSSFWVELPTEGAAGVEPAAGPERAHKGQLSRSDAGARLVLYVEDNPANVSFMRDLMSSSFDGVELVCATSAEAGIELARARQPAAIIMDINLPGMSGFDALHLLRGDAATRAIPVIALTAAASERDRQLGLQAGFFRYLTKPVRVDELMEAMEQVLQAAE
jgi:PAS domain S-box-containing protein